MTSGWSFVYTEGPQFKIPPKNIHIFHSPKIDFVFANCADKDEMAHYAAFHIGLRCLPENPFKSCWTSKDYCANLHLLLYKGASVMVEYLDIFQTPGSI